MSVRILAAIAAGSLLLPGCASIVSKSNYPVNVASNPSGANFVIKDKHGKVIHTGTTPAVVTLKSSNGYFKSAGYEIEFQKAGYAPATTPLSSNLDGWFVGNILFGGLIGMLIVDPLTGAMYKLPGDVETTLSAGGAAAPEESDSGEAELQSSNEDSLQIIAINDLSPEKRAVLVRIN